MCKTATYTNSIQKNVACSWNIRQVNWQQFCICIKLESPKMVWGHWQFTLRQNSCFLTLSCHVCFVRITYIIQYIKQRIRRQSSMDFLQSVLQCFWRLHAFNCVWRRTGRRSRVCNGGYMCEVLLLVKRLVNTFPRHPTLVIFCVFLHRLRVKQLRTIPCLKRSEQFIQTDSRTTLKHLAHSLCKESTQKTPLFATLCNENDSNESLIRECARNTR